MRDSVPVPVNIFRQLIGLEEVKWGDEFVLTDDLEKGSDTSTKEQLIKTKQTSLSDFLH